MTNIASDIDILFKSLPFLYHEHLYTQDILIRLFLSSIVGMMIGYNRQIRFQSAGLRTFTLMTLGSTIAMLVSLYVSQQSGHADASRIAAQVLSGVGFLGAGAIIRGRGDNIQGLTTAAGIWACSALGLAIGAGMYLASIVFTLVILFTLVVLGKIESKLGLRRQTINILIQTSTALPMIDDVKAVLRNLDLVPSAITLDSNFTENKGIIYVKAHFRTNKVNYKLNEDLSKLEYVSGIKIDY